MARKGNDIEIDTEKARSMSRSNKNASEKFADAVENENEPSVLEGSVERVIYTNNDNGYAIIEISCTDGELSVATGIMPDVGEGEHVKVYGKWVHNAKYGRQFAATSYEKLLPADADSILRYLASGAIRGIGPKTAQRIVALYGEETFDVIENHCEWLAQIQGISLRKAQEIGEAFRASAGMRSTMMFFRDYFGAALTMRIYKRWGAESVGLVKQNPYLLCEEIEGIGFERADEMARGLGFSDDGGERICAGVAYMMRYRIAGSGHVCLPESILISQASDLLGVEQSRIRSAIDRLVADGRLRSAEYGDVRYIYDRESREEEEYIARKLDMLDKLCVSVNASDTDGFILMDEKRSGITYAPLQRRAISSALESGVMILTGGPGTGKTTVVRALINIFESLGLDVALAAPTGRAANRMSEATSHEARTVHRLLEMDFSDGTHATFNRNEHDLLDEDVIVIDEASMIDQPLMCALLKAIKPGAHLIMIGDSDQLPSVGAGNVLHDLIDSDRFATVRLNEIFRQASESLIITNAHAINSGELPRLDVKDGDFFFLPRSGGAEIARTVVELCQSRLPRAYGKQLTANMQVISPSRRGEAGTENLNVLLQAALNPQAFGKTEYRHRGRTFRVGDRVMQTKNNYDIFWERSDGTGGNGIFNGDIGVITDIDLREHEMGITFDDRSVRYDFSYLDELDHAYAITVHKSQGSEYPIVIIPAYRAPELLLTRNMLYTAVTRAQKMVIIVGEGGIVSKMVENDRHSLRYTNLARMLG